MNADLLIVGIDPGLQGAIAVLRGGELLALHDMPLMPSHTEGKSVPDPLEVAKILCDCGLPTEPEEDPIVPTLVVIELVNAMPRTCAKTGRKINMGTTSMFNFGMGLGLVEAAVRINKLAVSKARPQQWKRSAGLINAKKETALERSRQLWPEAELHLKKHHGRAEALLIARYGHDLWPPA